MATLQDMLGVSSQTGLGPVMTAMNSQQANDWQHQQGLADIMLKQKEAGLKDLELQKGLGTLQSYLTAENAANYEKVAQSEATRYQIFGQLASQLGEQIGKMPPHMRTQALEQIGARIPGLSDQALFKTLLQTDPSLLPTELKNLGQQIALGSADFQRETTLQSQKDKAAMARQGAGDSAAMARTMAQINANKELESMRIDAGKYQKRQGGVATLMDIAGKAGYEKAATAAMMMANDRSASEEDRVFYRNIAEEFAQANERARAAGATGQVTLDPTAPGGIGRVDPYGVQGRPVFTGNQPPQAAPVPQGLPQGTINNGDGTFTLPDGRRVRPKQ